MGKFLTEPEGKIFEKEGKTLFYLDKNFSYVTNEGDTITVPYGFTSDMASIPKLFWSLIGSPFDYSDAALIHDFLCYTGQAMKDQGMKFKYSWQKTHEIFRQALIDSGVNPFTAQIMYMAVYGNWLLQPKLRW